MKRPSRPILVALAAGLVVIVAVVVVLVLTSGPSSPGDVTFRAGAADVTASPTAWCDVEVTDCDDDAGAVATLPVPPGVGLSVTVPEEVGQTPWQVAFTYRDAAGAVQDGRSPIFVGAAARSGYTLVLPDAGSRLVRAEVQQYGARLVDTPAGPGFSTRSTWVLTAG